MMYGMNFQGLQTNRVRRNTIIKAVPDLGQPFFIGWFRAHYPNSSRNAGRLRTYFSILIYNMRSVFTILVFGIFIFIGGLSLKAQNCIPTNINGTTINVSCNQPCTTLNFSIPNIKSTSDYSFGKVPYTPFPYVNPRGAESAAIYEDDQFGDIVDLPFPFCFYDSVYNHLVVGSNGLISFDISNDTCINGYLLGPRIPYAGGPQCSLDDAYYPRASIMGAYSDLDPREPASLPDRRIMWFVEGTAPCRKFVISYYHIGIWSPTGMCDALHNTFQIVLNESTGIIDVYFQEKEYCPFSSDEGIAILGIQNWNRDKAVAAPGRNATQWKEMNSGYAFVPTGGASRYISSELYKLDGTLVTTADTMTSVLGALNLQFGNVCPPPGNSTYVVKTSFASCSDPLTPLVGYDTIYLTRNLPVTATASPTLCSGGNNGSIKVVVPAGTGLAPYTFSLDGRTTLTGDSPMTFSNVAAGAHSITVTDFGGCVSSTIPLTVAAGPPLTTNVAETDVLCNGGNTGSIVIDQPLTGSSPFEYSLDGIGWQTAGTFPGLPAGNYIAYYREAGGCINSQPLVINEPAALTALTSTTAADCISVNSGSITIAATGGTSPYEFSIDGVNWQTTKIFNVAAGNYTVSVKDANNCIVTRGAIVTQPSGMAVVTASNNATCSGNDGMISVAVTGGNSPYQYSLDGNVFQPSDFFNVSSGTYMVTVMDSRGCRSTAGAVVGLTNNLFVTPQSDTSVCEGSPVQLQVNSNARDYSWSPVTGLNNSQVSNPVANPSVTSQYVVTASLGPCSVNDTVVVNIKPAPVPDAGPNGFICFGQSYTLQGSGGVSFQWTPSATLDQPTMATPVSTPDSTTIYFLNVKDAAGCSSLIPGKTTVDVTPPIHVLNFPADTISYSGDQFTLIASSVGNIYSWTPATGLSDPTISNPVITLGAVGTDQVYKVTASSIAGCKGEGYVRVRVYTGPDIYVPTAFTPNGDGRNDRFTPFPVGIKKMNYFKVFNRWGAMIFSTTTLNQGWDGKMGGKDQDAGIYVWIAEAVTASNTIITRKGTIALIR